MPFYCPGRRQPLVINQFWSTSDHLEDAKNINTPLTCTQYPAYVSLNFYIRFDNPALPPCSLVAMLSTAMPTQGFYMIGSGCPRTPTGGYTMTQSIDPLLGTGSSFTDSAGEFLKLMTGTPDFQLFLFTGNLTRFSPAITSIVLLPQRKK